MSTKANKMTDAEKAVKIQALRDALAAGGVAALPTKARTVSEAAITINEGDMGFIAEAMRAEAAGKGAVWAGLAERFGAYSVVEFKATRKAARKAVGDDVAKAAGTVASYLSRIGKLLEAGLPVPVAHADAWKLYNALREATRPKKMEEPKANAVDAGASLEPAPNVADPLADFWNPIRAAAAAAREAGVTVDSICALIEEATLAAMVEADAEAEAA